MDVRLQQIASSASGVYMLESDQSNTPNFTPDSRIRLFVVNIPRGRVNSIALFAAQDSKGFISEFGDIDSRQERQGNFSVRSCLTGLENGPIAVLNLRNFDDSLDSSSKIELSTVAGVSNGAVTTIPYTDMFDTSRFWVVDARNLTGEDSTKLLAFGNIGGRKVSVFARKSKATGYDVKVSEYYAAQNRIAPDFVDPNALVSDYMVDVYMFATDFSDAARNVANEDYGFLFQSDVASGVHGVKNQVFVRNQYVDGLSALSEVSTSGFLTKVTGSLIPGFTTMNNEPLFIENLINSSSIAYQTGVIVKVNEELLDAEADWLPGASSISDGQKRPYAVDLIGHGFFHINADGDLDVPVFTNFFSYGASGYEKQALGFDFVSGAKSAVYDNTKGFYALDAIIENSSKFVIPNIFSIKSNDRLVSATGSLTRVKSVSSIGEKIYLVGLHTTHPLQASGELFPKDVSGVYVYPVGHADAGTAVVYNTGVATSDPTYGYPMDAATGGAVIPMPTLTELQIASLKSTIGVAYTLLRVETNDPVVTVDATTASELTETITFEDGSTYSLVGKSNAAVHYFVPADRYTPVYGGFTLDHYKARAAQFTNGTSSSQKSILDMLGQVGIRAGILNKNFRIRYIVDCFKSYVEPDIKGQLAQLAKDKKILALANMPFMKDFAKSTNPYFRSTPTSGLDLSYIATGGNRDLPSSNTFTLPKYGDSHIAFFGPGLVANYYGQAVIVTPAAAVSKAFINKFIAGQPYDTVANDDGIISGQNLQGLEMEITDNDRNSLEPFGYNSIIQRSNGAFVIYGNQTAQNTIRTALSKIHVRELVMLIQERMFGILEPYVFKKNIPQTRLEVKTLADREMQTILDNGGVAWYRNICDGSNNTQEIIEADMGILDTEIIATRNGEKWVHRTHLLSGAVVGFEVLNSGGL